jgi:spore coat protein H
MHVSVAGMASFGFVLLGLLLLRLIANSEAQDAAPSGRSERVRKLATWSEPERPNADRSVSDRPAADRREPDRSREVPPGGGPVANRSPELGATLEDASDAYFAGPIRSLKIDIEEAEVDRLRSNPREYVRCRVREGDTIWTDVGVHLKGAAGSYRDIDDRPALSLNFDKFVDGQKYFGLDKLHLNNSVQDSSYLAEIICGELFRRAGVPAARATHVFVRLNGRDLGLYVLKEGFDKQFLRRYFAKADGSLWDGGFVQDVTDALRKTSGPDEESRTELDELVRACHEPDPTLRWKKLESVLDVDRFLTLVAIEVLSWHWDGYAMNRNNYRIYHDPTSSRLVFLPHGMDQMFSNPDGPIRPGMNGLVAQAVLATPEGRRRYRECFSAILRDVFIVDEWIGRVRELAQRLRDAIEERTPGDGRGLDHEFRSFESLLRSRAEFLERALTDVDPEPLRFGADGTVRISKWSKRGGDDGTTLGEAVEKDGQRSLVIETSVPAAASWRSTVLLDVGRYRFEARARATRIVATSDNKGRGAGVRISGSSSPRPNALTGTAGWKTLSYEFDVREPEQTVELVCELRAASGIVYFDKDSLRLVRIADE